MKKLLNASFLLILLCLSCSSPKSTEQETVYVPSGDTNYADFIGKDYLIDDQHSYIGFKIKYFGYSPVRGRFDEFEGTVFYDEKNISSLSVSLVIDVSSINTGNDTRDDDLLKSDTWFDAPQFPTIKFESEKVMERNDGGFDIVGKFTMKGITKEVIVPFERPTKISVDFSGNEQVDYSGTFKINRQDYEIYGGEFWSSIMEDGITQLSDEVEVELDIHTRRPDYSKRYTDYDSTNVRVLVLNAVKENSIDEALRIIDESHNQESISSGALSTIGNTLNEWKMHDEANQIFLKKSELFPDSKSTSNQLGITMLHLGNIEEAKRHFRIAVGQDSRNIKALEYLRLLEKL